MITRTKIKSKNTFSLSLLLSRLKFSPRFPISSPPTMQRDGEQGPWSVCNVFSATPFFSYSSPPAVWGPSHRRQSFTNCSHVGSLLEVLPFMNSLLQNDYSQDHRSCQQNFSSMGSSSEGCSSCQSPAPSLASSGIHLLQCGAVPGLQVDMCCSIDHHGL